jgi:L-lactate dehydrogenase (cytochrome)
MHILEVAALLQLRRPRARRTERVLARCVTVEDLRAEARRRWPRGVRGYVEGGADGEVSLRRNRAAFEAVELVPAVLRDVSTVDLATDLFGCASALPFALGPTGFTRMMHPDGELASARAALRAGVPYTLSTMATVALEDVAREGGQLWFQLYVWRDRGLTRELLRRAQVAGYRVLVVTVDTPVTGLRARDHHNGFTLPPRLTPSALADMAMHPAWCLGLLRGAPITFANFAAEVSATSETVMEFAARQFDPSVTWDDLAEIRAMWAGPMLLKGMLGRDDARRAQDAGMDGIALSNHGGRQLDQTVPPIRALEGIREAVGPQMPILVDSGIRHGADIAIALAAGATGALIGRPYLYGLGAAGQAGCEAAIRMLADELSRAMRLLGVRTADELRQRGGEVLHVSHTT